MTPIRSLANQYRGINAHLHSLWQAEGGWHNFHNRHIGDLAGLLRQQLLPMGYTATMEQSLQIRRVGDSPRQPRADILITDREPARRAAAPTPSPSAALTVADMIEVEDTETPYRAIAISEWDDGVQGEPVAWIELLSPTNKGETYDAQLYLAKRRLLLEQHLVFVEIDYLHELPPTVSQVFDYSVQQPGAHPYRIVVLDPRPDIKSGPAEPNEFDVDVPIPMVDIPLKSGDALRFDFGAGYRKTFEEMAYGLESVDYAEYPVNFERYTQADQTRIARRMLAALQAAHDGRDLEKAPFPAEDIPLDEARARIAGLYNQV